MKSVLKSVLKVGASLCLTGALLSGLAMPSAVAEDNALVTAKALSQAYAEIVDNVSPAVVGIKSIRKVEKADMIGGDNGPQDEFLRKFFENSPFGQMQRQNPRRPQKIPGVGSGVIIDEEGHILTNNHVIEDASTLTVQMKDLSEYEAEVVGADPKTDLAVIKIKDFKGKMPVAPLGDSEKMKVGNIVIAIGSPFGLMQTVTCGIVSAKGRKLGMTMYEDLIQTDATINRGNSGGPLVNLDGEVIGINTAIVSAGGGSDGIGFSVPINTAKSILEALIKEGKVSRGWLGIGIGDVTPDLAKHLENVDGGVAVLDVYDGTPAADAGLQPGDVLVKYKDITLKNASHLQQLVAQTPAGKTVDMTIVRKGKEQVVKVKIGEQPEDLSDMSHHNTGKDSTSTYESKTLGIQVQELTDEMRKRFEQYAGYTGVLVTGVDADSPAEDTGISAGDLIMQINQQDVKDLEGFKKLESAIKDDDSVLMLYRHNDVNQFKVVKLK